MDMKLEVVVVRLPDVDRGKDAYTAMGWRLDATTTVLQPIGVGRVRTATEYEHDRI